MAFHYVRDAQFVSTPRYHGNWAERSLLMYHFLRVAGCEWIWECDSERNTTLDWNHVDDGNMELSSTTPYWNPLGTALLSKNDSIFQRGTRSLRVIAQAQNDGVKTSALQGMTGIATGFLDAYNEGFSGPLSGVMTATCYYYSGLSKEFNNGYVTISGATNPPNNGTFLIQSRTTTLDINYYNPDGVGVLPDTASVVARVRYEIVLWARNSSGVTWNVTVDRGDGSDYVVGTIPDNGGVWTQYHFYYLTQGNGSQFISVIDPSTSFITPHEIYLDSVTVFRSDFEYPPENAYGDGEAGHYPQDGELINPDRFKSASYVPGPTDVGKYVFVWDPTNPTNSGAYKIIADLGGGVVQVDLRSGTAAFTAVGPGLRWRIVDFRRVERAGGNYEFPAYQLAGGVGIQSKHSSKWRLIIRHILMQGGTIPSRGTNLMAAPEDTEIDSTSGHFRKTGGGGPSTLKNRQSEYSYWAGSTPPSGLHHITCHPTSGNASETTRTFLVTDDDCSSLTVIHRGTVSGLIGSVVVGYAGADSDHPGIEEFILWAKCELSNYPDEIDLEGGTSYLSTMWNGATVFSPDGFAVPGILGLISMKEGGDGNVVNNQANAGPNPWSGEETLYQPHIIRDHEGVNGCPSTRIASGLPVYLCRVNMPTWTTFDSGNYYHTSHGVCLKWNGIGTLP